MNSPDFEIYNGALLAYRGTASAITLPDALGDIGGMMAWAPMR